MARGRKKKQQEDLGPRRLPTADEVKAAVAEAGRQKAHASEYAGLAGQAVKTFTERHGINRKAFGFITGLHKLDDQKRQSCLRDALILADRLGYFDQTDMFDDLGEKVASAVEDAAIGNDAERKARTEAELAESVPGVDSTVTERLREQEQWNTAGEVAAAKEAARKKASRPAGSADKALTDEIDAAVRPN